MLRESGMNKRRVTKPVYVGGVKIGGGADVTVQSMTKTPTPLMILMLES